MNKSDFIEVLKQRTKQLAIDIIHMYDKIQKTDATRIIGRQLIRSVTSTAANYRATCIARSQKEFFSKISIVVEEADETYYWLELLEQLNQGNDEVVRLKTESNELVSIFSAALKTAREKQNSGKM